MLIKEYGYRGSNGSAELLSDIERYITEAIEDGRPANELYIYYNEVYSSRLDPWFNFFDYDYDCPLIVSKNKRKSYKFNTNVKCRVKLDKYDRITLITKVR